MNRRFFAKGIGITLLGLLGIRRAAAMTNASSEALNSPPAKHEAHTSKAAPQSKSAPNKKDVAFESKVLMIFLIGATQIFKDANQNKHYYIDDLFPASGEPDFSRFTNLNIDKEVIKTFLQMLPGAGVKAMDVTNTFRPVANLFNNLFDYDGPDCPSTASLQGIVTAANQQSK